MSEALYRNRYFINFLLTADSQQQVALINLISDNQVDVLSEIVYNVIRLPKSKEQAAKLKGWRNTIERVAKTTLPTRTRKGLIKKHKWIIVKLLNLFSDRLLEVTQQLDQ